MKLFHYVTIFVGILILFNAAGYTPPASGLVATMVMNNSTTGTGEIQNVQGSTAYSKLITALEIAGGATIVAGLYYSLPSVSYLIAGFLAFFMSLFLIDMIWVYQKIIEHGDTWIVFLMSSIMAPLIIGFIITAIEWWQGSD